MAITKAQKENVTSFMSAASILADLPKEKFRVDYDKSADVLYVSFDRPQKATDSEYLEDEGIIVRTRRNKVVGLTILEASTRGKTGRTAKIIPHAAAKKATRRKK